MSKDKVNTNENKGLLWNVLLESGKFTNIPNTNVGDVRNAFENKIHEVLRKSNQSDTLVILNKRILEEITIELERYKTQVITHAEISDEKQKKFTKNLETKQNKELIIPKRKSVFLAPCHIARIVNKVKIAIASIKINLRV